MKTTLTLGSPGPPSCSYMGQGCVDVDGVAVVR